MTEDRAEAMRVTEIPRLALACLRELRLELDACLNLLRDDSRREGVDKHEASATEPPPIRPFRAQGPPVPMAATERTRLLPLVSALLTEMLAVVAVTEGRDEDHA